MLGMELCEAAVKEIMPLSHGESIQEIQSRYKKATESFPENWPELTLGTLKFMLAECKDESFKESMAGYLDSCAESLDLINS